MQLLCAVSTSHLGLVNFKRHNVVIGRPLCDLDLIFIPTLVYATAIFSTQIYSILSIHPDPVSDLGTILNKIYPTP
jgi:hypothetical protein